MKRLSFLLGLCVLTSGCVEDARLQLPPQSDPLLVLNSWFSPQYPWDLWVSHTYPVGDSGTHWVENAIIQLYEDGTLVGGFDYKGEGRYRTDFSPKTGRLYKVVVEAANYPTVEAQDSIPELVPIEAASFSYQLEEAQLSFKDPVDAPNFYQVGPPFTNSPDAIVSAELYARFNPYGDFFADQLINGQSYTYTAAQGFNTLFVEPEEFYEPCKTNPCYFFLRSLSPDLYRFHKTWIQHSFNLRNQSLFDLPYLTEPLNVHNNVSNGYGIFAAFSVDSLVIELK